MKFCNQDISKTLIAMSFKLGQLRRSPGEIKKKIFYFFRVIALANFIIMDMHMVRDTMFHKHNF